uniref:Gustatory receptor n=1 Tax=Anopheles quadriannulatus TaxID=34691 RepID=A0A182X333_ANOQN
MEPFEQWYVLSGYVQFHQWLGFQPYRLASGRVSPFAVLTLAQFLGVLVNLALIIYRRRCILYHCEAIGMVVDFIKLLTIGLSILVMYVELFRTSDNICGCWRLLYKAHQTLQRYGMVDQRRLTRVMRLYWWFVLGSLLYFVVNESYLYLCAEQMQTKRFYVYFFALQYILNIKLQQIIYPAILLDSYLRMTRAALEHHLELLQCSERLGSMRYKEFLAGKLNALKALYSDLFQASVALNEAYGRTYLIIYCKNYIHILSNSYWVVFWLLNNQQHHAARIISRLICRIILLGATFYINSCAMKSAQNLRHRLHTMDLGIQIKCQALFTRIESFLQQTQFESIQLTAGDFFDLNFSPILTIIFSVGAYISIFIQQAINQIDELKCNDYEKQC